MRFGRTAQPERRDSGRRSPSRGQSSQVFSYYAGGRTRPAQSQSYESSRHNRGETLGRSDDRTPGTSKTRRFRRASSRLHIRHTPSYLALGAVGIGVLWTLSLSGSPRVVVEPVSGISPKRDAAQYTDGVSAIWSDSWRNATKLTTDTHATEQKILQTYSELSDVRIQMPLLGRRPTIVLVPTSAVLRLESGGRTYYISPDGKALLDTSVVDTGVTLPTLKDEANITVNAGQQVIPRDSVRFVVQLAAQLTAQGVSAPSLLSLSNQAVNQVTMTTSDHSYYVKFQIDDPATVRQAVGSYIAVRDQLAASGVRPGEYMDVRIPEKVFYK